MTEATPGYVDQEALAAYTERTHNQKASAKFNVALYANNLRVKNSIAGEVQRVIDVEFP